jgi:muramoyltetrapeptide carboxypeptidase
VAVVAPGGAVDPDRLAPGLELLRAWGLEPVLGPHLHARRRWLAGRAEERAADLAWALGAPDLDAAWFARGGSGTADLLPLLPWERLAPRRPAIGFSDATALLTAFAGRGRTAVHGPVVATLGEADEPTREALRALLLEGRAPRLPGRLLCGPARAVHGPLLGGNLTVLASLCGTPWALRAAGALLLLEDVDEAPYRLERALGQLLAAGALAGVRGVAVGELRGCGDDPAALEALLRDRLEPLGAPVLHGVPVGHGPRNLPFVHGGPATLDPQGVTVSPPPPGRNPLEAS